MRSIFNLSMQRISHKALICKAMMTEGWRGINWLFLVREICRNARLTKLKLYSLYAKARYASTRLLNGLRLLQRQTFRGKHEKK